MRVFRETFYFMCPLNVSRGTISCENIARNVSRGTISCDDQKRMFHVEQV